MSVDDERALVEYATRVRPEEEATGFSLEYVVVSPGNS
jgi:hypothetical protein